MRRTLLAFTLLIFGLGISASAMAAVPAKSVAPTTVAVTAKAPPSLAMDPYLGGELQSKVPMARYCVDYGQCELMPNGDPCDTPQGCVCGWTFSGRKCGRF